MRSMSAIPVAPEMGIAFSRQSFSPLYCFGLCDAVIMTLASQPSFELA